LLTAYAARGGLSGGRLSLPTSGIPLGSASAGSGVVEGRQCHGGSIDEVTGGFDAGWVHGFERLVIIITTASGMFRYRHDFVLPVLRIVSVLIGGSSCQRKEDFVYLVNDR